MKRLLLAAFLFLTAVVAARSEMATHRTEFDVRFGILPIGKATFRISFDSEHYELGATAETVGLAEMVAPGEGEAASKGRITEDGLVADRHTVRYYEERKDKTSTLEMDFDEGAVERVHLVPDKRKAKKGPKWVGIDKEQLRRVLDPASSIIIPVSASDAGNPKAVCNRQLPVYDGDTRFDIRLRYKATKTVSTEGYEGFAFVCQLRYVPVAGHQLGQRNVEYMRDNEEMEIWLAPMARSNIYTPIRIEVPTWVGKFTAIPRYFGLAD